jgi:hypothetical protein
VVYKKRQLNLENLTTNSTLKQSKSIEISKDLVSSYHTKKLKDLVLILQIYRERERVGKSPAFLRKKRKGEENTKGDTGPSSSTMTTRPRVRMACPSSGGTAAGRPCGARTSSSSKCMCFTSVACMTPNISLILSNVICKNSNIPKSYNK